MSSGFSHLEQQQCLHRAPKSQAEEGVERKKQAQEWKLATTTLLCRQRWRSFGPMQHSQKSPQPSSYSWTRPCSWTADMSLVDPVTGQIGGYLHKIGVVGPELIRMVDGGQG